MEDHLQVGVEAEVGAEVGRTGGAVQGDVLQRKL